MLRALRWNFAGLLFIPLLTSIAAAQEDLIVNGGFEQGRIGWSELWTRNPGAGKLSLDKSLPHGGTQAVRIHHTASGDWSLAQAKPLAVEPGQIYELSAWVRLEGTGNATLGVVTRDAADAVLNWAFAGQTTRAAPQWRQLRSRFMTPPKARTIQVRLIGYGPATVWCDDVSLKLVGTLAEERSNKLPKTLSTAGKRLRATLDTDTAALALVDGRSGRTWQQDPSVGLVVLNGKETADGLEFDLIDSASLLRVRATCRIEPEACEMTMELQAVGIAGQAGAPGKSLPMAENWAYPPPFATQAGMFLILPVNEGMSYPVDDATIEPMWYHLYGGHGLSMAWYGMTDRQAGVMTIVDTPDDAAVEVPRRNGRLSLAPLWVPQKGAFGPPRRLRYVVFDAGGYVAMAKRYRQQARQTGLLKTLEEKRAANPHVDQLVGAVNVWCWDRDAVAICRELQKAGIQRILWSGGGDGKTLEQLNDLGVLTSRYDIYQDTMNPAEFPKLRGKHGDWTTEAWPKDLVLEADGRWERGWEVEDKKGGRIPCGVLCDRQAVDYARRRIPAELKAHPYGCRFIDTTTASPWRECYSPDHPMTRSESKRFRMDLLDYVSKDCGLVTGSETGHEAAVPYLHYFEGMMSLGPYRLPDSGRDMARIVQEPTPAVAKFQTGHYYRLPLWELVYHDCVVAQWYWGDYNNKLPTLWDRRDLFNALYGTPPMFMFHRQLWQKERDRFVRSYQTAATVARKTGYSEMLSHRWVTDDHAVQETRFANGVRVTVNLGQKPYTLANGAVLPPLSHRMEER